MTDLRTIVYVSSACHLFTELQLEALLVEARELNFKNGVTGVLLYEGGNFMQCFEGSPSLVADTYQRILASRRHKSVIELLNEPIRERVFPDWQMGFAQPSKSEMLTLSAAEAWKRLRKNKNGNLQTAPGLSLLQGFWRRSQR